MCSEGQWAGTATPWQKHWSNLFLAESEGLWSHFTSHDLLCTWFHIHKWEHSLSSQDTALSGARLDLTVTAPCRCHPGVFRECSCTEVKECQVLSCCSQRTKPASDIPSVCPWCLLQGGLSALSTALPYQLLNKGIKKLVAVAKYRHYPIKILHTSSEEPSTDLIKSLWWWLCWALF